MFTNREKYVFEIENNEQRSEGYVWEIDIPPRSQIVQLEALCLEGPVDGQDADAIIDVKDFKFNTGLLSSIGNSGTIRITSQKIAYTLTIDLEEGAVWHLNSCDIKFYSKEQLKSSYTSVFTRTKTSASKCWEGKFLVPKTDNNWDDNVDRISLYFLLERISSKAMPSDSIKLFSEDCSSTSSVWDVSSEFFLSKDHSDFTFICEGQEFPSHKLLLSIRSPVFCRMLQPSSDMAEVKEGKILITDMKPSVLKEFLRFMYYGKVENLKDIADLLIIPADKYDLPSLKTICEKSLLGQLDSQNALALFSLGETVQAKTLMLKSYDCIKMNKSTIFQNSEELIAFSQKHPDTMAHLLKG